MNYEHLLLIHKCPLKKAKSIIRYGALYATTPWEKDVYGVHNGPFFFLEGYEENEKAHHPQAHEVTMYFECILEKKLVKRSEINIHINKKVDDIDECWKNICWLETFNQNITQARIIPNGIENVLKLVQVNRLTRQSHFLMRLFSPYNKNLFDKKYSIKFDSNISL